MINIIQNGIGNIGSVIKAVEAIGHKTNIVRCDNDFNLKFKKIIMPGVGSFDSFAKSLKDNNLFNQLKKLVLEENFFLLGICVGMQVLFDKSEEGKADGLGLIEGEIIKFKKKGNFNLKIPHMGWNTLKFTSLQPAFQNDNRFYFAHSYHAKCLKKNIVSYTNHFYDFPSIVNQNRIYGMQFHPEKSYNSGLNILKIFVELND